MTEDEFNKLAINLADSFVELYGDCVRRNPKPLVLMAMTGALAACATEAGVDRNKLVAALNCAFDDIEAGGE